VTFPLGHRLRSFGKSYESFSTIRITPPSRVEATASPLLSNTFNIGVVSANTSATNSLNPGVASKDEKVPHEGGAQSLPLILIDHGKRDLGPSGPLTI
jgi:hypothetical protein